MPPTHLLNYLRWRVGGVSERGQQIFHPVLRCRSEETTQASRHELALAGQLSRMRLRALAQKVVAIVRRCYSWKFNGGREKVYRKILPCEGNVRGEARRQDNAYSPATTSAALREASAAGASCALPPAPPRGGDHRRFARGWPTYSNTHK
eukprot:6208354-Pleurochrysis_carterae.AAC.2